MITTRFNSTAETPLQGWTLVNADSDAPIPQTVFGSSSGEGITLPANSGLHLEAPMKFIGNRLSSYAQYLWVELAAPAGVYANSTLDYDVVLVSGDGLIIATRFSQTGLECYSMNLLVGSTSIPLLVSPPKTSSWCFHP